MVIHKDFAISAENVRWIDRDDLTEVVPGLRFQTPHRFYEQTLGVFINGLRVELGNDDGYVIIDDQTIEMKESCPLPYMRVTVAYVIKEI